MTTEFKEGLRMAVYRVAQPTTHVLLLQGRTEFIEKYVEVIDRLTAAGCTVATLDWRGQGLSGPEDDPAYVNPDGSKRGHIDDFADYDADLDTALAWFDEAVPRAKGVPRLLIAHSMGAMIGLRGLLRHPDAFDGAVLSAPMWGLPSGSLMAAAIKVVGAWKALWGRTADYAPTRGPYIRADEPFESNRLTSDPARFERYHEAIARDPRLGTGGPTMAWLTAAQRAIDALPGQLRDAPPRLPILILSARADEIIDPTSHDRIAALLLDAERVVLPDARHEPLMERDAIFEDVMARILSFAQRLRPAPD